MIVTHDWRRSASLREERTDVVVFALAEYPISLRASAAI